MNERYTKDEEDQFFKNLEFSTLEDDRKAMKESFGQDLKEEEQVNNLLNSCSNWLSTRGKMPYFRNTPHYSQMMQDYGFKLLEVQKAYNRLLEKNKQLEEELSKFASRDGMGD